MKNTKNLSRAALYALALCDAADYFQFYDALCVRLAKRCAHTFRERISPERQMRWSTVALSLRILHCYVFHF